MESKKPPSNRKATVAKAGKRSGVYVRPPSPDPANRKGHLAGEQQFFSKSVPNVMREEITLSSGEKMVKLTPIFGVWDSNRKRWIRNQKEADRA